MTDPATMIYLEAKDSLEVLDALVEDGYMPDVEASDFRESLQHIVNLAIKLGAEAA